MSGSAFTDSFFNIETFLASWNPPTKPAFKIALQVDVIDRLRAICNEDHTANLINRICELSDAEILYRESSEPSNDLDDNNNGNEDGMAAPVETSNSAVIATFESLKQCVNIALDIIRVTANALQVLARSKSAATFTFASRRPVHIRTTEIPTYQARVERVSEKSFCLSTQRGREFIEIVMTCHMVAVKLDAILAKVLAKVEELGG